MERGRPPEFGPHTRETIARIAKTSPRIAELLLCVGEHDHAGSPFPHPAFHAYGHQPRREETHGEKKVITMAVCEVCGNDYELAFEVIAAGESHVFDSFECAIHRLAPRCERCGVIMIGHGHEVEGRMYCCGRCARSS